MKKQEWRDLRFSTAAEAADELNTVDAEGHFQVNFQYEYSQGDSFIERVTLWEYEQTGYTGTNSSKEIVKKYHPEFEG